MDRRILEQQIDCAAAIPVVGLLALLLSSCGTIRYNQPVPLAKAPNSIVIEQPRETFWRAFIPALSTQFFVINNLDKDTGLINLSYGADPQQFIDCGRMVLGGFLYKGDFPVALPDHKFNFQDGYGVWWANRQMSLDGRMNIVVQEIDPRKTNVIVIVRYVVNRRLALGAGSQTLSYVADSVAFSYGEYGNFPDPHAFSCRSNGALEQSILAIAKSAAVGK